MLQNQLKNFHCSLIFKEKIFMTKFSQGVHFTRQQIFTRNILYIILYTLVIEKYCFAKI